MKVLHIGKFYPPFCGGIEKVNYDLVENLNKIENCNVDELCFQHLAGSETDNLTPAYRLFRVPIRTIFHSTPISMRYFSVYRKIRNHYDIIHLHLPNPWAALAPLLFRTRAKIVLHWHSDIVKQKSLMIFYRPFQTMLLRRASRIIVTSRNYFDSSSDLQPYVKKVRVVPIGLDTEHLMFLPGIDQTIKTQYPGKKIVLSIGRLTYYKGFRYLIEAACKLRDDTIVLIGGCGELQDELERLIKQKGVADRVKLIGRIPQEQIGAYFAAADLFCLPSIVRTEAFGVVLAEALAMGVPIVACDILGSGVNWVNKHGDTGLNVPVCDSQALAAAINKILDSPELLTRFKMNCKKRYESFFSLKKMGYKVYEIYDEILNSKLG